MKIVTIFTTGLLIASISLLSGCSDEADSATTANTSNSAGGLGPSTPTGIVSHRDFRIGFDPGTAEVFDAEGNYVGSTSVEIVISADDINDLIVDGQTVNIRTEWGSFADSDLRDSCVLQNGSCSVTWLPGDKLTAPSQQFPLPAESAECRVAFTAWTSGEEKFADVNDNGLFDTGESFTDLPEPYLDINESGLFSDSVNGYVTGWDGGTGFCNTDQVCEMIDINRDLIHNDADGIYNGSLCGSGNPLCSANSTSTTIWTTSYLLVGTPFDHDDNAATPDEPRCNPFKR